MSGSRASVSRAVVRFLNRLGFGAATFLTLAIPLVFAVFSFHRIQRGLELETSHLAQSLEQIVMNRPDFWQYEILRLQEFMDEPVHLGGQEDRLLRTPEGRPLVRSAYRAPWPSILCTRPIHDSGRVVGLVEARHAIRGLLAQTLLVALLSAGVGWGLFLIFRLLPVKALGAALAELSEERRKLAATLRGIPDGVIAADGQGTVIFLNPAAEWYLGCTEASAIGRPLAEIYPAQPLAPSTPGASAGRAEIRFGTDPPHIIEERYSPLPLDRDGLMGRVIVFRDITAQLRTEAELLRVRQIESLGVLAGGIAHDFNNYLSAILGNITLASQDLPLGGRASERLAEAMKATDRARALSLKLLTFAKGGDPARRVLDLAPLVREAGEFVTTGTGVRFTCAFEPDLWNADVDDGLLSQVIHNLVINAVQAMQGQGHVHIRTEKRLVTQGQDLHLAPGQYLRVSIQDSGPGIPASILPRIFEPYFTTKDTGHGLGLSSCFNIMKAHGGNITAETVPGGGAVFRLDVPATDRAPEPRAPLVLAPHSHGRGQVLVMDDDPVLAEIASEMLARMGFTAHSCADGEGAIRAYTQALKAGSPFSAVIMDLTIPGGMGGREAAAQILAAHPGARLIVSSGYSVDPVLARPGDFGFLGVLPKPYGLQDLARALDLVVLSDS